MFYQYKKVEKINNDINDKIILWKYVLVILMELKQYIAFSQLPNNYRTVKIKKYYSNNKKYLF